MVRGQAWGHSALCPYKMHIAPTLTSEFGMKRRPNGAGGRRLAALITKSPDHALAKLPDHRTTRWPDGEPK